jgi:hypothetical protein
MPRRRPTAKQEIAHLESHVQEAVEGLRARHPAALRAVRRFHPSYKGAALASLRKADFTVDDARLAVAREHGFETWAAILAEAQKGARARWNLAIHERTDDPDFRRAIQLVNAGNVARLRNLLAAHPDLARKRLRLQASGPFANPGLLEIAAAAHQRGGRVPADLVHVASTVLKAGADRDKKMVQRALNLASANSWDDAASQRRMIRLLLRHGATPEPAMPRAAFQGAHTALEELVRHGGRLDFIAAATLGRVGEMQKRLSRTRSLARRKALALASVHGQTEAVRLLLDAGLDPDRMNPRGFYEHSTPIHQAVWFDRLETVKLLVERGADLTIRDKTHKGTPLDWAVYGKKKRIESFLRSKGAPTGKELATR